MAPAPSTGAGQPVWVTTAMTGPATKPSAATRATSATNNQNRVKGLKGTKQQTSLSNADIGLRHQGSSGGNRDATSPTKAAEPIAKVQNLFGDLRSNNSNEVCGGPTGTTRTAGTADTTHKTDSANNSNSGQPGLNLMHMKPPRNLAVIPSQKQHLGASIAARPGSSNRGSQSAAFRFYHKTSEQSRKHAGSAAGAAADDYADSHEKASRAPEDKRSSVVASLSLDYHPTSNRLQSEHRATCKTEDSRTRSQEAVPLHSQAVGKGILENYKVGAPVGQGAYAVVHVCIHKPTK